MTATEPRTPPPATAAGDLVRAALGLGRNTARMLGCEARVVLPRVGRRAALLVVSAVVVGAGAVVVLAGAALLAEHRLGVPRWAGLALAGGAALVLGLVGIRAALRGLASPDVAFPRTLAELSKDADALGGGEEAP